jgi:hypothetical protein
VSAFPTITLNPAASPAPAPDNGKRFFIWTIGCQMNEADSAKVAATLQEVGYRRTEHEEDADIVVLNSCVVRQAAEDKVAGKLNSLIRLKRENPDVSVVLTGCMVTNQQEKLRERFPTSISSSILPISESSAASSPSSTSSKTTSPNCPTTTRRRPPRVDPA